MFTFFHKKQRGTVLIMVACIAIVFLVIGVIVATAALVGQLTGDNAKKGGVGDSSNNGQMCTQTLEGHSLSETTIVNGQARVSQFGSPDANLPSYCRDTGDNGIDGFDSSKRPTGCDVNNPQDFFAAVCPTGGTKTCGGSSWWHLKNLIVSYNGKSVTVTIRDRGPNPNSTDKQLDLSYAALHTLGADTGAIVTVCLAGGTGGDLTGMGCGNVPSLKQYDPAWASVSYDCNDGSTIKSSGCGITSAAMVLRFYGKTVDPPSMAKAAIMSGNRECGNGTGHGFFPYIAKQYGLKDENGISWDRAMTLLKQGKPIIISGSGPHPFSQNGHFIVLTCYNADGTISVNDPAAANGSYPEALLKHYQHFVTAIYN